jgi:hypothetical protein
VTMANNDILQVTPEAASAANMVTSSVATQAAPSALTQPAQISTAGAAHAASIWAPTIAGNAVVGQKLANADATLDPRTTVLAKHNDQALIDVVETEHQNTQNLTPQPAVDV